MSMADNRPERATPVAVWRLVWTCWKLNLAGAMEFRMSFLLTAGMMFVNNMIWLAFWGIFFTRFPVVNGWELQDVMLLWAISAGGFGWASILFGNFTRVATMTAAGELDLYLAQPKPVLIHLLVSRMSLTAIGDFLFGLAIYAWVGDHSWLGAFRFGCGLLISGCLFLFFVLLANTLVFYIGQSEGLAFQVFNSFLALTTYPSDLFRGAARLLLFTVVPAGWISYMPIGLLRETAGFGFLLQAVGMMLLLGAISFAAFYYGLRRYTSGNQIMMRS
ncbi:ABC transporter permease [Paenibacillus sp. 598K]|uniref:ABC transporter permease n=1 Tax=Paenibacillus sp. 598K TaxID=1117987 RepID=UPI0021A9B172|nr:ABC-2 family transporter protein [Paenibacillus sp. 598K]